MIADSNVARSQFSGYDPLTLLGLRIFHPEKIFGKQRTESPMDFTDSLETKRADRFETAFIDPLLDCDVGCCFELQIPFSRVPTVIISERSFDIHRVRVMAFDEIRVVTVHRPNEAGEIGQQTGWQAASKSSGFLSEVERQVCQWSPLTGTLADQKGFHFGCGFASIRHFYVRFYVHFNVRFELLIKCNYSNDIAKYKTTI
ncbi:MAG TPA: hypothetical protein VH139_00815 [Acidobacteriaceae bacterium]|nr:hypothetical protein [Acidobacteriaceae bacterium]